MSEDTPPPVRTTECPLFAVMRLLRLGAWGVLDPADRLVVVALADRARWEDGQAIAWPSLADLCQTTGHSRTTVYRALGRLVAQGVVRVQATGRASRYVLVLTERFQNGTSDVSGRNLRGSKLKPQTEAPKFHGGTSEVSKRNLRGSISRPGKEEAPIEAPKEAPTNPPTPPAGAGGRSREGRLRAERDALLERASELGLELDDTVPRRLLKRLRAGARPEALRAHLEREAQRRTLEHEAEQRRLAREARLGPSLEGLDALRAEPERAAETWALIAAEIERQLNRHSFATWFRPLEAFDLRGPRLYVRCPTEQFGDWLAKNYHAAITQAVAACGLTCAVEVRTLEQLAELLEGDADAGDGRAPPRAERAG